MNSLSWLIYFAELSESLGRFFGIIGSIGLFAGGFLCAIVGGAIVENNTKYPKILLLAPIIGLLMIFIAAVLPSKNTVMYIAASEYGEKVIMSKEVQDLKNPAFELLKEWMKKETAKINASKNN